MPYYFYDCYTQEEIKDRYRTLVKTLHPDKGGTDEGFRELQEQYESEINGVRAQPQLPPLFHVNNKYEYFRSKVTYFARDNHWYKFHKEIGADIWVDANHVHLIYGDRVWL